MSDEVALAVDGVEVAVPAGATLLDACRAAGVDLPTLCRGDTLTPANACRVCVVELDGSRVLVPSCSRPAESGMVVRTGTDRARHSRRLVLELLASSVELDRTPGIEERLAEYGADPQRFGPDAATVAAAPIVDNELYVRDYARCILCYQCVDACGEQWQGTFAIAVAGRGFDARISTEWSVGLPESACVYCGNCIAVCPTGALVPHREFELRADAAWRPEDQTQTDTVCPYCGVGCTLTLHVQDGEIVKVTSPHDHDITRGNLCVKGRFGWQYVHVGTTRRRPG
jgi:predicted molibdopterin-dependent oxidoreductase YjgC